MDFSKIQVSEMMVMYGGLTLGLLSALGIIYKLTTNHGKHLTDLVEKNTAAFTSHADAMQNLAGAVKDLKDEIRSRA